MSTSFSFIRVKVDESGKVDIPYSDDDSKEQWETGWEVVSWHDINDLICIIDLKRINRKRKESIFSLGRWGNREETRDKVSLKWWHNRFQGFVARPSREPTSEDLFDPNIVLNELEEVIDDINSNMADYVKVMANPTNMMNSIDMAYHMKYLENFVKICEDAIREGDLILTDVYF